MSEQIQPGTPVRVEATYLRPAIFGGHFVELTGGTLHVDAVTVTPLDPERPTLDRESLRDAARRGRTLWHEAVATASVSGDENPVASRDEWVADAVLALIQAAHPEWNND